MSTTGQHPTVDEAPSQTDATDEASQDDTVEGPSKMERLRAYLADEARCQGELYFKSKFIADDVGLSSKEIGALMVGLQETTTDLEIEKWSYTSATTWRITLQDSA
jgi:hypothetical protein